MKAIVQNGYGSPDVLELKEIDQPVVKDDSVLVQVHAASVNAGDYFSMRGSPWVVRFMVGFPKPKNHIPGWDVAGQVKAVGKKVTQFQPGDEVFGACSHTFAEYVIGSAENFAIKPTNVGTFAVQIARFFGTEVTGVYGFIVVIILISLFCA